MEVHIDCLTKLKSTLKTLKTKVQKYQNINLKFGHHYSTCYIIFDGHFFFGGHLIFHFFHTLLGQSIQTFMTNLKSAAQKMTELFHYTTMS